jgi:GNAT superfamily N-acetyltransferase
MVTFAVERLTEGARATMVAHFLALPMRDRTLRFGIALAPTVTTAYVAGIDLDRDAAFGVRDAQGALAGVAHLAYVDDVAELALSVLPAYRSSGIATALFERAAAHARARRVPMLFMHFLSGNVPVMRIAQKFHMDIFACGRDAEAYLKLSPVVVA